MEDICIQDIETSHILEHISGKSIYTINMLFVNHT